MSSNSSGAIHWTDSHCHLQDPDHLETAEQLDAVLVRAAAAGVERMICIGTGLRTSARALAIARAQAASGRAMWASIGLHPHDAIAGVSPIAELLRETAVATNRARRPGEVVAVGECGLDYHYEHSPRDVQRTVFAEQIALAEEHDLTLVIHTRDAWDDTFEVLDSEGMPSRTVIHCFTGGPVEARRLLDLGAYLSFSGIVTFKNAVELRSAAVLCPIERLLVETDAPFLAPVPHRGQQNEPAFVSIVGEAIAALRGEPIEDLALATSANATAVFALAQ